MESFILKTAKSCLEIYLDQMQVDEPEYVEFSKKIYLKIAVVFSSRHHGIFLKFEEIFIFSMFKLPRGTFK